ncbi:MAG: hypothetical protein DSM106950_33270 [Stigonema ocellatum SAG 48.90 = DSM 106950]|nr:hypothetical protein [Stigonema ocellatum SAG 48.90 = DSM 106950]
MGSGEWGVGSGKEGEWERRGMGKNMIAYFFPIPYSPLPTPYSLLPTFM